MVALTQSVTASHAWSRGFRKKKIVYFLRLHRGHHGHCAGNWRRQVVMRSLWARAAFGIQRWGFGNGLPGVKTPGYFRSSRWDWED